MQLNLMDFSNPIQKRFKELYSVNIEMISSQQMITTGIKILRTERPMRLLIGLIRYSATVTIHYRLNLLSVQNKSQRAYDWAVHRSSSVAQSVLRCLEVLNASLQAEPLVLGRVPPCAEVDLRSLGLFRRSAVNSNFPRSVDFPVG